MTRQFAEARAVASRAVRFILFVIDDRSNSGNDAEMARIDEFNQRLRDDGHWVMAAGIAGPVAARVIDGRSGESRDGSLFDAPHFYSGFWIIEAPDASVAESLALAGSRACGRRVELRPFLG